MEITLEQIREFNICPMIYKFKYLMKIDRQQESTEREYHEAMRKSIMFFYYQVLNGKQPTLEQLRQKFGSLFYKGMSAQDIMAKSTMDSNLNALNLQGVKTLTSFYERESRKKFVPIAVDMDVRVPIGDNFLLLTIDLIREMKYEERQLVEVVRFTNTQKKVDTFYVNHNVQLTAYSYAFRKLFQTSENRLIIQHMKSGKEFFTVRKDPEFRRLEAMTTGVCGAIQRNEFYPVHNHQCNSCAYRDVCDKYKF